ncbi:pyridoxamine 5'-phosphate oxidase family protein [Brevibacillus laterosporus]|uniref:pyridoxamine 5'-phosphate oxidase family protein n=1 Tax=Brevibacillus laterosporus TaxID=1465 RepID=UPI00036BF1C7|nr:pyridoxamine 5'-phosphate oxidase family protein [Brevibacillus laterosporus]ATO48012.1 pyridoxamine 5-phosphate oxidase [Brevibacillus laterosporus DSM 25]MBG9803890.1 pyridoxamine 5-phosphate oxidase [Brevibacillus laterosporus]MED2003939.1 pyridoxamine 5'-phosphate oxidase family protein [Brevibacillus laterosporus]MED4765737.1 pyridoxamine 5'-phosphate oxidase family protein [Brevibacillus laterosporus]TPH22018.1 pyridoxamine 5'-phosphate oxidase family protein [Brevibacillus laterospor
MSYPLRRSLQEVHDQQTITHFLETTPIGHVGFSLHDEPYVIPVNFVWTNGCIYFHGSMEGRKNTLMAKNPRVCFTVSHERGTLSDPIPAHVDTAYFSVLVFGQIELITDPKEATGVLQVMLDKYVPGYFDRSLSEAHVTQYRSPLGSAVGVFKIVPTHISAKENPLKEHKLFYPGKKVTDDVKKSQKNREE